MESRPRIALRKSDMPPDMIMRRSKADNDLNHSPWNANQTSLTERNSPVTTTRNPKIPIKDRKMGPMEISCVLNIVFNVNNVYAKTGLEPLLLIAENAEKTSW